MDHYRQSLLRYLKPSQQLQAMQSSASLALTRNPTEYLNVFGVAFRYLRYLQVRKRIKATSTQQYGRLAEQEVPAGELHTRADRERQQTFLYWLQDPDRVVYDEALSKAWRNYQDKRQAMNDERGRIAQMIFGEPKQNYENARANLLSTVGVFLYNRWKKEARGNLEALQQYLQDDVATRQILQLSEVTDAAALLNAIVNDTALKDQLYDQFSHEGRKLLDAGAVEGSVSGFVAKQLVAELNMLIANGERGALDGDNSMAANRRFLNSRLPGLIPPPVVGAKPVVLAELSVLDILLNEELRADFILECKNLLLFDSVYDRVIDSLDSVAAEAQASQALSQASLVRLLDQTLTQVMGTTDEPVSAAREQLFDWHQRVMKMPKGVEFFAAL